MSIAAFALLEFGGTPRGVEVMQGDESALDVGALTHLRCAAHEYSDGSLAD
jgi:hypothetical protein